MSKKKIEEKKLTSQIVSDFLDLLKEAKLAYDYSFKEVGKLEQECNVHLHDIEFCKEAARKKVATRIVKVQRERRKHKDVTLIYRPLVDFQNENKGFINKLQQTLGDLRKEEAHLRNRFCNNTYLKEEEYLDIYAPKKRN